MKVHCERIHCLQAGPCCLSHSGQHQGYPQCVLDLHHLRQTAECLKFYIYLLSTFYEAGSHRKCVKHNINIIYWFLNIISSTERKVLIWTSHETLWSQHYSVHFLQYAQGNHAKKCQSWNLKLVLPDSKAHFMTSSYLPDHAAGDVSY